jgi:putative phosphoesterase
MRVAVLSDTHGYFDPQLADLLRGVEEILHAGDVGTTAVLDQLGAIAPTYAVRGNVDSQVPGLPPTLSRRIESFEINMLHELPAPQSVLREWCEASPLEGKVAERCRRFIAEFPPACRMVIFGHSHEPCAVTLGGILFFNPGSAGKKRFSLPRCYGMLDTSAKGVRATFHGLEGYNRDLPASAWLPAGGARAW